jgi:hypothetical protein
MVQIAMLVLAFPLGAMRWSKTTAVAVTAVVFGLVLVPQTISVRNDGSYDASYWVVQAITAAVAFGLVTWGSHWRASRRARRVVA